MKIGKRETRAEFTVIAGQGTPLLGKETATKLGVLKVGVDVAAVTDVKAEVRGKYPNLFTGVGKLKTKQIRLNIDDNVEPVAQPLKWIPFHLREAVDKKIEKLLRMDIIEKVEGPTPWVNPVVVVPKDTDIRLCLDMRMVNRAIIRGRYPIPTVDELLHDMNGSVVFSKLNLKWGYHQMELTEQSRDITTVAIHSGKYRYKRLIFRVSSASEQENASEVRSFLGLAGYSSGFIPQLTAISQPLQRLTKKDVPFVFSPEQKVAFESLKKKLAEVGTLAYFDKDALTKVIADAGPVGMGADLIQEQQGAMVPICYVSRSLTDCEKRYSQTEREALALVWACECLHPYIYGKRFDLVTDHKALEVIYSPRSKPCARIVRSSVSSPGGHSEEDGARTRSGGICALRGSLGDAQGADYEGGRERLRRG